MEDLSQELIDHISGFLDYDDLKATLTVSPKFQIAAEICSGAFEKFTITKDNADKFLSVYSGRRVHYLRRIRFRPTLPAFDSKDDIDILEDDDRPCRESEEDLKQSDEHFTSQIGFLFATLQALESSVNDSKRNHPLNIRLTIYTPTRLVLDEAFYCRHRAYVSWRLHLLSPEQLPTVSIIRALVFKNGRQYDPLSDDIEQVEPSLRSLDLRIILDLANKLSGLELLKAKIGGEDWQSHISWPSESSGPYRHGWDGPHRDSRISFADAAATIGLPDLKHADLDFMFPLTAVDSMDQRQPMPNLSKHRTGMDDRFSSALRLLSYPLKRLHVQGVFDTTLFQPCDNNQGTPFWPNLEVLNVSFHPVTPSGAWYFRGKEPESITEGFDIDSSHYQPLDTTEDDRCVDRDYDYPEWNCPNKAQFRTIPVDETIVPFLTAFANATAAMPSLKEAALWSPLTFQPDDIDGEVDSLDGDSEESSDGKLAWGLAYTVPGTPHKLYSSEGTEGSHARQVWWSVGNWRPSPQLARSVREIGKDQHGDQVLEYWEHDGMVRGLYPRSSFEGFKGDSFGY